MLQEFECSVCHKMSTVKVVNYGIGAYEFWGAPGVDTKLVVETTCCEAAALLPDGSEVKVHNLDEE